MQQSIATITTTTTTTTITTTTAMASGDSESIANALKAIAQLAVLDSNAKNEMMDSNLNTFQDIIGIVGNMDPPFDMYVQN